MAVLRACQLFRSHFYREPLIGARAPGRVNLMGGSIDYCQGYVLPMAVIRTTIVVGGIVDGDTCTLVTTAQEISEDERIVTFRRPSPEAPLECGNPFWANYVKGVLVAFDGNKGNVPAFEAVVVTDVPLGGGLSSSAALEVATYLFLEQLCPQLHRRSEQEKALSCQWAEHNFPKVPCGIMDQFVSLMARENQALLIDCRPPEEGTPIPLDDPDIVVLVTNSNVKHDLSKKSEYPLRRQQCYSAAKKMGKVTLRDATIEDLETSKDKLSDAEYKRARHVIREIKRTYDSAEALKRRDYEEFGRLITESHYSLRDDHQVSCTEVDELVRLALEVPGVYGSHLTGGGFGGCTVTLVKKSALDETMRHIKNGYQHAEFIVSTPCGGAHALDLGKEL